MELGMIVICAMGVVVPVQQGLQLLPLWARPAAAVADSDCVSTSIHLVRGRSPNVSEIYVLICQAARFAIASMVGTAWNWRPNQGRTGVGTLLSARLHFYAIGGHEGSHLNFGALLTNRLWLHPHGTVPALDDCSGLQRYHLFVRCHGCMSFLLSIKN